MIKAIPMEDWLRGCVYHDGRHGEVTLPTNEVLKIANYIQRTRQSTTDGLIDLEVVEVSQVAESIRNLRTQKTYDGNPLLYEPQTERSE